MDVMVFLGREGLRASSLDPTGANLPRSGGPWTPLQFTQATDVDELAALAAYGFDLAQTTKADVT